MAAAARRSVRIKSQIRPNVRYPVDLHLDCAIKRPNWTSAASASTNALYRKCIWFQLTTPYALKHIAIRENTSAIRRRINMICKKISGTALTFGYPRRWFLGTEVAGPEPVWVQVIISHIAIKIEIF